MKVQDLIELMEGKALGEEFQSAITGFYRDSGPNGMECETEKDFLAAMGRFEQILTAEQKDKVSLIEKLYSENRNYTAAFGFKCGLYGAFKQYFMDESTTDGGFAALLCDGLFAKAGMMGHPEYYDRNEQCRVLEDSLETDLEESEHEHLTSLVCAWQERIYNAAVQGFYCGYRAAYSVIDGIDPLGRIQNISKILTTEFSLGFIQPYSDVERLRETEAQII